jgi:hypothetical protein
VLVTEENGCIGKTVVFKNMSRYTNEANIGPLFSAVSFVKKRSHSSSVGKATILLAVRPTNRGSIRDR